MDIRIILKAIGFLSLEAIGVPGNLIILACFLHFRLFSGKFLPVDVILSKLSFINLVVVVTRGVTQSLTTLGVPRLDQHGCNVAIFIYRVSRAMSICMTSLLSCYQCILLAPSSNPWSTIKKTLIQNLSVIIIICWCINITHYLLPMFSISWLVPNATVHILNLEFCLVVFPSYSIFLLSGTMSVVRDTVAISLMSLSSLYIVYILYRHRRTVRSIRSSDAEQRNTAETKAASAVLMLVCTYVFFFGLDNAIWLYSICTSTSTELTDARVFFGCCYSALSPLVILATNKKMQLKVKCAHSKKHTESSDNDLSHLSR